MAVEAQDRGLGVPEPLGHDADREARTDEVRGAAVAKFVNLERREAGFLGVALSQPAHRDLPHHLRVLAREEVIAPVRLGEELFDAIHDPEGAERPLGLRRGEDELVGRGLPEGDAFHGEAPVLEVEIVVAERDALGDAEAVVAEHREEQKVAPVLDDGEELPLLLERVDVVDVLVGRRVDEMEEALRQQSRVPVAEELDPAPGHREDVLDGTVALEVELVVHPIEVGVGDVLHEEMVELGRHVLLKRADPGEDGGRFERLPELKVEKLIKLLAADRLLV